MLDIGGRIISALAGSDAVAEADDEEVAHRDLGGEALRAFGAGDVHGSRGDAPVADAKIDRLGAVEGLGLCPVAVVEGPGAGGPDRRLPGKAYRHGMIGGGEIAFLHIVAGAGFADAPAGVDAEPADRVARPAAAVALHPEDMFGTEHGTIAPGVDMQQEVALLAEQAESIAYFPGNVQRTCCLCRCRCKRRGDVQVHERSGKGEGA
jgi:hypothetical protein